MTDSHIQRDRARQMRREPTEAEYKLWFYLRAEQLGVKFRRQLPLGDYIVDFVCLPNKLIVELDGGQHTRQRDYDEQRTRWLNSQGFQVLRFWNCDVLDDVETVIDVIWRALGSPSRSTQPNPETTNIASTLPPSPRRGGLGRGDCGEATSDDK